MWPYRVPYLHIWLPKQYLQLQRHPNQQVQQRAPSPYGVYNTVYTGELLTYQPYVPGGLLKLLD